MIFGDLDVTVILKITESKVVQIICHFIIKLSRKISPKYPICKVLTVGMNKMHFIYKRMHFPRIKKCFLIIASGALNPCCASCTNVSYLTLDERKIFTCPRSQCTSIVKVLLSYRLSICVSHLYWQIFD